MKATLREHIIIICLKDCRFQAGSFDKKFVRDLDVHNISPLQQWWIYKLGYKYRKQIGHDGYAAWCKEYIDTHQMPLSRKQSEKIIRKAKRESVSI